MPFLRICRLRAFACSSLVAVLTACGAHQPPHTIRVVPSPSTTPAGSGTVHPALRAAWLVPGDFAARVELIDRTKVLQALAEVAAAQERLKRLAVAVPTPADPMPVGVPLGATTAGDYRSWSDWPRWRAVGLCEQRGTGRYDTNGDGIAWHGSPAGGLPGSAYPGGLGLSVDFWRQFAPQAGVSVPNGAEASPAEQILVARQGSQDGTHMGGWSSWPGCVHRMGG